MSLLNLCCAPSDRVVLVETSFSVCLSMVPAHCLRVMFAHKRVCSQSQSLLYCLLLLDRGAADIRHHRCSCVFTSLPQHFLQPRLCCHSNCSRFHLLHAVLEKLHSQAGVLIACQVGNAEWFLMLPMLLSALEKELRVGRSPAGDWIVDGSMETPQRAIEICVHCI